MKTKKVPEDQTAEIALIARKDWHILSGSWNKETDRFEHDYVFKAGQPVGADLPDWVMQVLRTETVI